MPAARQLSPFKLQSAGAVVAPKLSGGLTAAWVDQARETIRCAVEGHFGPVKFLVFDLAAEPDVEAPRSEAADRLLGEIANLILTVPIVTVAYGRKLVGGGDLELALACSMLVCDEGAEFSFAADPVVSVATYALLAQKIGFVRAERLMEREEILNAAQMRDLLLLKETVPAESGLRGLEHFLLRAGRRHNSAAAMYRAQRIATPLVPELFGEQPRN
jgi:enoyl-CoA hydratase/carnithine racemase